MKASLLNQFQKVDWLNIGLALLALLLGLGAAMFSFSHLVNPLLAFVGIIGIGVAIFIFLKPEWGLIGLVVMVYSNLSEALKWNYGAPSIAQPFITLLCCVIVARWAVFGERPRGLKVPALLVGLYGFTTFISMFYAKSFSIAQRGFFDFIKVAVITLLITTLLRDVRTFRKVIWALIGVGAFLCTISVFQSITGTFDNTYWGFARPPVVNVDYSEDTARTAGPIGDPNFFSQILVVLIPLALDRFWNARSLLARSAAGYALAVLVMTVMITFSRGAFLSMMVGVGILFIGRKINPLSFIITPLVLVLLLPFAPANYADRLLTLTDFLPGNSAGTTDYSFRGRTSEMLAAVMMFEDHPLLGVGVGNYNVRYLEYSRVIGLDGRFEDRSAHSLYLEIAAERGLLGLTFFSILMGVTFYNIYKSLQVLNKNGQAELAGMMKAIGAGLIAYLFASIFLHDAFPRFFWLVVGVCLSTIHVTRAALDTAQVQAPAQAGLASPSFNKALSS